MQKKILIIEDNRDLAHLLESHLRDLAFQVDLSFDGTAGLAKADSDNYDLVILDLMLPGLDGIEICQRLRRKSSYVPILMLTAKSSEMDRVVGLEVGADDYVTKPFSIRELLARVKAIFRRTKMIEESLHGDHKKVLKFDGLEIDIEMRKVLRGNQKVELSPKEFELLAHLYSRPGLVCSKDEIGTAVWPEYQDGVYDYQIENLVRRLRLKLEPDPKNPQLLLTVRGRGYKLII